MPEFGARNTAQSDAIENVQNLSRIYVESLVFFGMWQNRIA